MDVSATVGYWVERLGLPVVVLAALWWAAAKVIKWWAPRIERWVDSWFTSNENTQQTYRNVATTSLDLQKSNLDLQRSNSTTLQGLALTITAMHEKVTAHRPCPLGAGEEGATNDDLLQEFRQLRADLRSTRRSTIARRREQLEKAPPPDDDPT